MLFTFRLRFTTILNHISMMFYYFFPSFFFGVCVFLRNFLFSLNQMRALICLPLMFTVNARFVMQYARCCGELHDAEKNTVN